MLGIPTRSDVVDEQYQRAVHVDRLRSSVHHFGWPTSTVFLHSHVVNAVRHMGGNVMNLPERLYEGESNRHSSKVEPLLNPQLILEHYLSAIENYEASLEEARPFVDRDTWTETMKPDKNEGDFYPLITIEECSSEWMQRYAPKKKRWSLRRQPAVVGRRYTFNPYLLAVQELANFKLELQEAFQSSSVRLLQIRALWAVVKRYDNSTHKGFLSSIDNFTGDVKWPMTFEYDESSEAYRLRNENECIAEASDLYVRFDEWCWCIANWSIPAAELFSEPLLTRNKLWHRNHLRELIAQTEQEHSERGEGWTVVVNGVTYKRVFENREFVAYKADGQSYQEIVDLLGKPVLAEGASFSPSQWAEEEIALVGTYRNLPTESIFESGKERSKSDRAFRLPQPSIVQELLARYTDFDNGHGLTTDRELASQLLYTLRLDDWKTLYQTS